MIGQLDRLPADRSLMHFELASPQCSLNLSKLLAKTRLHPTRMLFIISRPHPFQYKLVV
jgi:hypothetical protein